MGFRGSRVQIPPSRLLTQPGCCLGCRFSGPSGPRDGLSELPLLAHNGEERFVIGLLVALEERLGVLPATRRGNVLQRVPLPFGSPFAPVGVPEPTFEL